MNSSGIKSLLMFMYSYHDMGVAKYMLYIYTHAYSVLCVLMTLFHNIFDVIKSTVRVVSLNGNYIK